MQTFRATFHRIDAGTGRAAIALTIDGNAVTALAGDTLLSVLLMHRGALRRSEAGGDRRAGFCGMGACQDCWISLSDGRRLRACSTLAKPGMALVTDLDDDL